MDLAQNEIDLISRTIEAVAADKPAAAQIFYKHLFERKPDLRSMFIVDMQTQGEKLTSTLEVLAAQVGQEELYLEAVKDLALRHLAYGVRPEHYSDAGAALQFMLREMLGDQYTKDVAAVWDKVYSSLSQKMIEIAYPALSAKRQ